MYIGNYVQWRAHSIWRNGALLLETAPADNATMIQQMYASAGISYPKFFKMDMLSKAAFVAAALTVPEEVQENKDHIATVFSTASGCLDVDRKFEESRQTLASPALFVYTLPNIMLGEICIRYGFKGEQMCTVSEQADPAWFAFYVADLLQRRGTSACLCGHVEATATQLEATLLWITKEEKNAVLPFNRDNLAAVFNPTIS